MASFGETPHLYYWWPLLASVSINGTGRKRWPWRKCDVTDSTVLKYPPLSLLILILALPSMQGRDLGEGESLGLWAPQKPWEHHLQTENCISPPFPHSTKCLTLQRKVLRARKAKNRHWLTPQNFPLGLSLSNLHIHIVLQTLSKVRVLDIEARWAVHTNWPWPLMCPVFKRVQRTGRLVCHRVWFSSHYLTVYKLCTPSWGLLWADWSECGPSLACSWTFKCSELTRAV